MGWLFPHNANKNSVIKECTENQEGAICLAKSCIGDELWTVWEYTENNNREIILFLLKQNKKSWGYKPIAEETGPYFYKCPLKFLSMVPEINKKWREKVLNYHAKQNAHRDILKRIKLNSVVECLGCNPNRFIVIKDKPLVGRAINGGVYNIPKHRITGIVENLPN